MKISDAILADPIAPLPPIGDLMYQYVIAGNGLFIRAEDSRLKALVQISAAALTGLCDLIPFAELKIDRVQGVWLRSILRSALRRMPNEAMYQFWWEGTSHNAVTHTWRCSMPYQTGSPTALRFTDDGEAVIDLHSHNSMPAFFSGTDDADEQGLRFYAVIGRIDTDAPEIRCRVGVYGHHMDVPAALLFDDLGPFVDQFGEDNIEPLPFDDVFERTCRVCGCTDAHGCLNGCFWVADDLCSNCGDVPPAQINSR